MALRSTSGALGDALYASPVEASVSQEIEATRVSVPKHFGHSKVRESKPCLSGSMIRNAIIYSHFGHRGLLIWFTNTAHPPRPGPTNQPLDAHCANLMFGR